MVSKLKREELAKKIMELSRTSWFESICHDDDEKALILVDEIVEAGWVPIEDFPDEEYSEPTPAQVGDIMSRIIHGLPTVPLVPEGVKLYDVNSLYPKEFVSDWYRIPDFDNYEINSLGEIRNRWTKRILEFTTEGNGGKYVEMHDKEGFNHYVSVDYQLKTVFGI